MRSGWVCGCVCLFVWAGVADAGLVSYEFEPTPADLCDLEHSTSYTWGLRWSPPDDAVVAAARIEIDNLVNWTVEPNILYIHLLNDAPEGVTTAYDGRSGDWFAGQGILLTTFTDTGTWDNHPVVDWSYDLSPEQLIMLNEYMADGQFGFGFDPDCHYYNDGVKLTLLVGQVPEPAVLVLLGLPLPLLLRRQRTVAG